MKAFIAFMELTGTILRISMKLVLIMFAFVIALIGALVWKR